MSQPTYHPRMDLMGSIWVRRSIGAPTFSACSASSSVEAFCYTRVLYRSLITNDRYDLIDTVITELISM